MLMTVVLRSCITYSEAETFNVVFVCLCVVGGWVGGWVGVHACTLHII